MGWRGVCVGSDLPAEERKAVTANARREFEKHPHILQRFAKTRLIKHAYFDFAENRVIQ